MRNFRRIAEIFVITAIIFLFGCQASESAGTATSAGGTSEQGKTRGQGEMARAYAYVPTTERMLSLTVHGMDNRNAMARILDALDDIQAKATFFLPGMRVAEEPEIALEIIGRGHEIGNQTLNGLDMRLLDYERTYREIGLASDVIERETGIRPRFVSTRNGEYTDEVRLAAAELGLDGVFSSNLRIGGQTASGADEMRKLVRSRMTRGGIIAVLAEDNPDAADAIRIIGEEAARIQYRIVPLGQLLEHEEAIRPAEQIPGYDAASIRPDAAAEAEYRMIRKADTTDKVVSLTFDDWGSDYTITGILDILDRYQIPATFFLRVNGVEYNPNLARAIRRAGHEVANHTFSHPDLTTLTPQQVQEEVVKAHRILTEALQEQPLMMFRPPRRAIDHAVAQNVAAAGYPLIVNYDVTAFDWDLSKTAEEIIQSVIEKTTGGSIILLHILDDLPTLEALPVIIEHLRNEGYTFVTITELIGNYPTELEMLQ